MSFGFGVGDFLAVIKLASDIRKDFADAPEQFQQINAEIRNLVIVLGDVDVSLAAHDVSEDQNNNLKEIRESCRGVLEDSRKELSKYLSLDSKGGSLHERTKRVWKRVKWEPDDIRDLRHRITANIVALNSFTGSNIRDTVFKLEDRQIRQENREILEWLTPLDTAAQQADFISQRQEGTGQWLLDSNEYIKWKATKGEILFCHGIPGAGKTILSSIVVENLQDTFGIQTDVAICYFYFNFKSQGEQKFENVLLSLLKQLSQASATVPDDVQALFNQCKSNRSRPSREGIIRTLSSVAGSFSRVLIVVDALDECESSNGCQRELISHLIELQRNTGVNILATSRPVPHIVERFKEFTSAEVRASEGDIHRYVESNLMNLPRFVSRDKELQDEIKKGITKAVDGMFLLAKLHLDSLKGKKSPRALRQTLNTLATGNDAYDEAYQNTMLRISGQLSDQKELGMNTLMWIVHAKRPLETVELQHALGVEIGESELFEDSLPDLDDLVSACCGLVTIDEESHIIRLIHYTTQEFFDRHGVRFFPFAETQITNTCVTYLAFDIFESGHCFENDDLRQRLTDFPLYGYSSQYWGQHADPQAESEPIRELLGRPNHAKACGQFLMALENQRHGFLSTYRSVFDMTGLHLAAYFGLAGVVGSILDDHLDPDIRDSKRRAPLWYAARNGHQDVVGQLLDRNCQPDGEDQNGATLFQQAVQNGHEAVIRLLLDYGADVNQMDKDGETPLYDAVRNGHEAIVRLLLDHGANVNQMDEDGETPLHYAATKNGREAIMRLLLDHGANVNQMDKDGETPLHYAAARNGHEAIVRLLLDHGANVKQMDDFGRTPLYNAAMNGREAIMRLLLDHGADVNQMDEDGKISSYYAATKNGRKAIMHLLQDHGANINRMDKSGETPLHYAARNGHEAIMRLLLDHGADVNQMDKDGETPLCQAASNGYDDIVRLLLDHGVDVNQMDEDGGTPLFHAASNGYDDTVRLLLDHGADINHMDKDGETPLFQAASNGYDNIVRLLLDHGADVNHIAEYGETPLSRAAKHGYEAIMRLLLDHGAGVNHIAEYGETPLSRAAKHGHEAIVRLLLDHGAGVNHMDEGGVTPLSRAARNGREAIVEMLVKHGANINVRLPGNEPTLLLVTARRAFWRIVDLLLATGADHESRDIYGRSALVYAIIWDHPEAVDVLLAQNKLDLDAKDHWGSTAISFAARSGNVAAFRKIAALPNVDLLTRDSFGRTPLWWAQKQRHDIITTEILAYQRSNNHDMIETHMRPAIGEPVEFLNTGAYCDVCFASVSLYEPRFYCSWCDNDKLLVCQECHGLGARCFVEWHELLIYDEDVRSDY